MNTHFIYIPSSAMKNFDKIIKTRNIWGVTGNNSFSIGDNVIFLIKLKDISTKDSGLKTGFPRVTIDNFHGHLDRMYSCKITGDRQDYEKSETPWDKEKYKNGFIFKVINESENIFTDNFTLDVREYIKETGSTGKTVSINSFLLKETIPLSKKYEYHTDNTEFSEPPSKSTSSRTKSGKNYISKNYIGEAIKNNEIGFHGERFVFEFEKKYLIKNNREYLSKKVTHVSHDKGDGDGYDILSYNLDGSEKYIEVKTTTGNKRTPFYFSSNELIFSKKNHKQYYLYRVFNLKINKNQINASLYYLKGKPLDELFEVEPVQYSALPKSHE